MTNYPCPYCRAAHSSYRDQRAHVADCPEVKRRLRALGTDLEAAVGAGSMTLEAAEAEQAKRPGLVLE